jgi:hypothetical protein
MLTSSNGGQDEFGWHGIWGWCWTHVRQFSTASGYVVDVVVPTSELGTPAVERDETSVG